MTTIGELSAPYGNFMLAPVPGPGVCERCFDLTYGGHEHCYHCGRHAAWLDAVLPISYSVAHEQLHHVLAAYKRQAGPVAERFRLELSAVLWRFLERHEPCLAWAAATPSFDLVTTIPSSSKQRDAEHPLPKIVGQTVAVTRPRFRRLLVPTEPHIPTRQFSFDRYATIDRVTGRSVLLIDDTWTTGASAHSAAACLKQAGATTVAALVIGRHLHRDYADNGRRLKRLPRPLDWERCALEPAQVRARSASQRSGV